MRCRHLPVTLFSQVQFRSAKFPFTASARQSRSLETQKAPKGRNGWPTGMHRGSPGEGLPNICLEYTGRGGGVRVGVVCKWLMGLRKFRGGGVERHNAQPIKRKVFSGVGGTGLHGAPSTYSPTLLQGIPTHTEKKLMRAKTYMESII